MYTKLTINIYRNLVSLDKTFVKINEKKKKSFLKLSNILIEKIQEKKYLKANFCKLKNFSNKKISAKLINMNCFLP